jgi:hypothetical protein
MPDPVDETSTPPADEQAGEASAPEAEEPWPSEPVRTAAVHLIQARQGYAAGFQLLRNALLAAMREDLGVGAPGLRRRVGAVVGRLRLRRARAPEETPAE